MNLNIELISIGTELLSGRTLNSHAQTLGSALSGMGLRLARDTTIPDEMSVIQSAVTEAFNRTDIVVVSGGLGPTVDDITREALADLFGVDIVLSQVGLDAMRNRFAARGIEMTLASERMALVLDGSETLVNSSGSAAAQRFVPWVGKTLFIVPGPPNEFAAVLGDHLLPWLRVAFPGAAPDDLRVMTTQGLGESAIVTRLEAEAFHYSGISVGFYPGAGKVEIRLSAPPDKSDVLDAAERTLRELLHGYLID